MIPTYERDIVQRTLCLLCGFDDFSGVVVKYIHAPILLSMTLENWRDGCGSNNGQIFNLDMLKEACGCLVTISADQTAKLAHFTVKEFLFSERLRGSNVANIRFFALFPDLVHFTFTHAALAGVLGCVGPGSSYSDTRNDLYDFLLYYGIMAMSKFSERLRVWSLKDLVLQVLEPTGRHYQSLFPLCDIDKTLLGIKVQELANLVRS